MRRILLSDDRDIHSIISLQKEFNTRTDWYAVAYYVTSTLDGRSKDGPSRSCFRKGREGKDEGCYY